MERMFSGSANVRTLDRVRQKLTSVDVEKQQNHTPRKIVKSHETTINRTFSSNANTSILSQAPPAEMLK